MGHGTRDTKEAATIVFEMSDEAFFRDLAAELEARGRVALATVVETRGSGPSRVGRRFLVFDDGTFRGTIGGGPFEALVIADAAALFRDDGPPRFLKWYDFFEREIDSGDPREPTNMICGGSARVSVELLKAAPSLVILGGGHVGLALARLGLALGYEVLVGDDRGEYARPDRFPPGVRSVHTNRNYGLPPDAPAAKYLGLIGSARKVRGVMERLASDGVAPEKLEAVRAPIGLSIGAVTPEEIAVAILAEVTAVRRGAG